MTRTFSFPGARAPDRERTVDSSGVKIAVYEWGAPDAPPVLFAHGGFDFARTLDAFAPLIAAGGWRVVSWDHRGHGCSDHTGLYSWDADVRDLLAVLDSTAREPCPAIGHSKGGGLLIEFIHALPHRFERFVAIDMRRISKSNCSTAAPATSVATAVWMVNGPGPWRRTKLLWAP